MAFGRYWRDRPRLVYHGSRSKERAMDLREKEMGLEEFGEFLLRRRIVPEKNAKFYVGWVRKFLGQEADPKLSMGERIDAFVEGLRQEGGREEWQIEQAERAVKTYFHSFQDGAGLE